MLDLKEVLDEKELKLLTEKERENLSKLSEKQVKQYIAIKKTIKSNHEEEIRQQKHENAFWQEVKARKEEVIKYLDELAQEEHKAMAETVEPLHENVQPQAEYQQNYYQR